MYFPFLRGKRHELAALRKTSPKLNNLKIRPIIEPVKTNHGELVTAIKALNATSVIPLVIINPLVGDFSGSDNLDLFLELKDKEIDFLPCIAFSQNNFSNASALTGQFTEGGTAFATYFRDEPTSNVSLITSKADVNAVRFTPNLSQQFQTQTQRLVKVADSFEPAARNADFSELPYNFSDAHLTYSMQSNAIGFGDFLIVGEEFSENGGPARAVALHITYIEPNSGHKMLIKHCVSKVDSGTTTNTAKKFLEALDTLVTYASKTPAIDQGTVGFQAFLDLHSRRHFPNLGPVKENSIMHHLETLSKLP